MHSCNYFVPSLLLQAVCGQDQVEEKEPTVVEAVSASELEAEARSDLNYEDDLLAVESNIAEERDSGYGAPIDAYSAPQAPEEDSYGAPQAPPEDSYGAPLAPPEDSYGSPQAPPDP